MENHLFQIPNLKNDTKENKEEEELLHSYLASLFYKSHRIGAVRLAVYSAYVMSKFAGNYLTIKRFQTILGEDGHPAFTHLLYPQILGGLLNYKDVGDHYIWQTSYQIASIPKWYMDELAHIPFYEFINGEELESIRQELYSKYSTKEEALEFLKNFKFPSWVFDEHVRGKKAKQNTILSGMPYNRKRLRKRWLKFFNEIKGLNFKPREIIRKWSETFINDEDIILHSIKPAENE